MHTFVIGNSLVRNVVSHAWTTICLPCAVWNDIVLYVCHNRDRFNNAFIYILIGPVRFTSLDRECGRRNKSFITEKTDFLSIDRSTRSCVLGVLGVACPIIEKKPCDFCNEVKRSKIVV